VKGKKLAGADPAALARKETSRARHRRLEETAQVRGPVDGEAGRHSSSANGGTGATARAPAERTAG
jgi:hypothetical protein